MLSMEVYFMLSTICSKRLERSTLNNAVERKGSVKGGPIKMLIRECKCLHLLNHPLKIKRVCHNNILQ